MVSRRRNIGPVLRKLWSFLGNSNFLHLKIVKGQTRVRNAWREECRGQNFRAEEFFQERKRCYKGFQRMEKQSRVFNGRKGLALCPCQVNHEVEV